MIFQQLTEGKKPDSNAKYANGDAFMAHVKNASSKSSKPENPVAVKAVFDELTEEQILASRHSSQMDEIRDNARREGLSTGTEEGLKLGYEIGFQNGFQSGIQEGRAKFEAENEDSLLKLKADIAELLYLINVSAAEWAHSAEDQLCGLVGSICRKVLGAELETKEEYILDCVRAALDHIQARGQVKIRINPLDRASLEAHRDWIHSNFASIKGIAVVSDPNIRSGCVIETETGIVDAQIDTAINNLEHAIQSQDSSTSQAMVSEGDKEMKELPQPIRKDEAA